MWFFLFSFVLTIDVSVATKNPDKEKIVNLTFGTIIEEEKLKNKSSYNWVDILISIIVVAIFITVMIFFNGK